METSAWETSKENVLPIKSGRSAKGLNNVLPAQFSSTEKSGANDFEQELKNAKSVGADPLDVYVRYFKWTREQYPSNASKAMQVLEQCTSQLTTCSKYKNDIRFVQLWVEYVSIIVYS